MRDVTTINGYESVYYGNSDNPLETIENNNNSANVGLGGSGGGGFNPPAQPVQNQPIVTPDKALPIELKPVVSITNLTGTTLSAIPTDEQWYEYYQSVGNTVGSGSTPAGTDIDGILMGSEVTVKAGRTYWWLIVLAIIVFGFIIAFFNGKPKRRVF